MPTIINVLSLFSGIGAFESALRRGGYDFRVINYCEIDRYAAKAYSQIHGISEDYNLNDVCIVNPLLMDNVNLVTYGFPCQDISIAGKQKGFKDTEGNRTRSGLFFEALRIIEFLQPEYAIAENVKALTGKKFTAEFETVLTSLDKAGYNNYWKVLNAKDYGVPQNRERVFIVSIRKDIDKGTFTFPEKQPLTLRVKDLLEPVVDEKYYLKSQRADDLIRQILAKTDIGGGIAVVDSTINDPNVKDVSNCITARYDAGVQNQKSVGTAVIEPKIKRLGNLYDENADGARAGNTYDPDGLAPALQTAQGGNRQPLIVIGSEQKHASINTDGTVPCLTAMMGLGGGNIPMITEPSILKYERTEYGKKIRNQYEKGEINERRSNMREFTTRTDGVSNTLTTVQKDNYLFDSYRIRKLTPLECFRLMGFTDEEFERIQGISNTQLYKMAGNSICVPVLEAILRNLFKKE